MVTSTIKITQLQNIGSQLNANTVIPVVSINGVTTTDKANVGGLANFILSEAGNTLSQAYVSTLSQNVVNAAQPNITSVGTLSSLSVTGNVNLSVPSKLHILGGTNGYFLQTNGLGNLSWAAAPGAGSGSPGGSNSQVQYNNEGFFDASPDFTYDPTISTLSVPNIYVSHLLGTPNITSANITSVADSNLYLSSNNGAVTWIFGKGGALVWPSAWNHAIESNIDDEFEFKSDNNIIISTDVSNTNSHFTFAASGIFYAPSNVVLAGTRLDIGPGANTLPLLNATVNIYNSGNPFVQAIITNGDPTGSADWVAGGDNSTDDEGWIDIGFASSAFNDPLYTLTGPGDGYIILQTYASGTGGNLVLATGNNGTVRDIIFGTGGFDETNEFGRIVDATQQFHIISTTAATDVTTGAFVVDGGAGVAGNLHVGGDVAVTGNIQLSNGLNIVAETIAIEDGDTTSLPLGTMVITSNVTGIGNLFMSNGSILKQFAFLTP